MKTLKEVLAEFRALPSEEQRALLVKALEGVDFSGLPRAVARSAAAIVPLVKMLDEVARDPRVDSRSRLVEELEKNCGDPWVQRLLQEISAEQMRGARDKHPEILKAIIAARRGHNDPAEHPYGVAGRILGKVNSWLEEAGHKRISKDTIARRIPRSPDSKVRRPRSRKNSSRR